MNLANTFYFLVVKHNTLNIRLLGNTAKVRQSWWPIDMGTSIYGAALSNSSPVLFTI
jgi:hypothetical protein